jgi:hypothetical protein
MSYRIAGIDVHKKMLAVVVSDVEIDNEYQFERRKFSSNPEQLRSLATWLLEQEAEEVVMETTTCPSPKRDVALLPEERPPSTLMQSISLPYLWPPCCHRIRTELRVRHALTFGEDRVQSFIV